MTFTIRPLPVAPMPTKTAGAPLPMPVQGPVFVVRSLLGGRR